MTRKRGKQRKAVADAVPEDVLAEGSGPLRRVDKDAITTVEDVVTTDDIATTDDVVTADDIVATADSGDETDAGADASDARSADAGPVNGGRRGAREAAAGRARRGANGKTSGRAKGKKPGSAMREASADAGSSADAGDAGDADAGDADAGDADAGDADAGDADAGDADAGAARDADGVQAAQAGAGGAEPAGARRTRSRAVSGVRASEANGATDGAAVDNAEADVEWDGELVDGDVDDWVTSSMTASMDVSASRVLDSDGEAGDDDDAAVVFPTSAASMDAVQLKHLVEALIFASDRPLTVQRLRQLTRVGDVRRLQQALTELSEDYDERGLILQQVSGGYQFRTRTQFSAWVQQLIAGRPVRLSRAQLETLAIIAYRQPITRPEIDDIRGVDSTATLKLLIDRMLIRVLGKREEVGRPMLYGTTKEFLDFFSLGDLRELPTLREYSELTAESRKVMSDRLGIAPDGDGGDGSSGGGLDGSGSGGGFDGSGSDGGGSDGGGGDDGAGGPPPGTHDGGISDNGAPAGASAADEKVSEALSVFWAAADAVDRSTVAQIEETDDDAPADTWFDPAIGTSLDDPDVPDPDEPVDASAGSAATPGSQHAESVEALDEQGAPPGSRRAGPVAE